VTQATVSTCYTYSL